MENSVESILNMKLKSPDDMIDIAIDLFEFLISSKWIFIGIAGLLLLILIIFIFIL